ncbi:Chymotrypsin-like protease CTRL-1 [Anabarilius grahami]|uniref:Chymotrypsin-like protease CTRL-1 n=1 Tax=Anabarilius grahami TaxID=495550 RepID=A0A3N0YVG7_ANAGA|nr:Chymotrypsin-like protease CTRL-1 [Anabarilius grahami]
MQQQTYSYNLSDEEKDYSKGAKGGDIGSKLKKILHQIDNDDCDGNEDMFDTAIGIMTVIPGDSPTVPYSLHLDATTTAIILEDTTVKHHKLIMIFTITCLALVASALGCGVPAIKPQTIGSKIVNGQNAISGSWPWQVSLQVTVYWVGSHRVILGEHDRGSNVEPIQVKLVSKVLTHPLYSSTTFTNDIALLKLASPVVFTPRISPVCLAPSTINILPGTRCFTTGWGRTATSSSPLILQQTGLPIMSPAVCRLIWGQSTITDAMICAGAYGSSSCQPAQCPESAHRQGTTGLAAAENASHPRVTREGLLHPGIAAGLAEHPLEGAPKDRQAPYDEVNTVRLWFWRSSNSNDGPQTRLAFKNFTSERCPAFQLLGGEIRIAVLCLVLSALEVHTWPRLPASSHITVLSHTHTF